MADETPDVDLTEEQTHDTNNDHAPEPPAPGAENTGAESATPPPHIEPPPAEPKAAPAADAENSILPSKDLAQMAVLAIESFVCLNVPSWVRSEEFTPTELKRLDEIVFLPEAELTSSDKQLLQRNAVFTKRMGETMPLDDKTRKLYTKQWERVIDQWQLNLTPTKALLMSTAVIVGSRAMPVITAKGGRLFSRIVNYFSGWGKQEQK